ncbi:MAG TPA: RNA polymerase sigma factor [Lachnospiraceae bacterium]|nr:RNA polymerase sigma factor [Lachnospiraceae bacterium]
MSVYKEDKNKKFISIYHSYMEEIYQYIYLRIGLDKSLAEDLTQDIFLDVYKGMGGFKGLCSERTWIFRIARNTLYDYYRKQYNQKYTFLDIHDELASQICDPNQDIDQSLQNTFDREQVYNCLKELPAHYRITLLLKYIDNRSIRQIAQIADKSEKATESLILRARRAFIEQYQRYNREEELRNERKQ